MVAEKCVSIGKMENRRKEIRMNNVTISTK